MMYRVIAIVGGALALAACSSSSDWMNLDALKPAPAMDSVQFESDPPGAEAKVSNGQSCRTPCALALPSASPLTVTFTLAGYQPETETIEVVENTGAAPSLRPNPVAVALTAAPPPPKPAKKPAKPAAKKPATASAKPAAKKPAAAQAAPASAPAPMSTEPPPQQAPSPWPTAPAPQR